jgi:Glycosyl hydrolase family 26
MRGQRRRAWSTRCLGAVALLALAIALVPGRASATSASAGTSTGPSRFGVYAGAAYPPAVRAFATTVGIRPHYAMDFLDGSTWRTITQGRWPYTHWKGKGYTMIWGVNMLPDTYSPNTDSRVSGGSCNGLTQGASGRFDHYFRTVAANIVRAGFSVSVIRFGWEFNGNWFPWAAQGCAAAYVRYFDDIVTTMRSVPGSHFTFEWNPTRGDLGVGLLSQYYPGNKYVDDVGLDVYDLEQHRYPGAKAEFRHMLTQRDGLNWLATFATAHHKAIVLPEWGLGWGTCSKSGQPISASGQVCGGDDATWVDLMTSWIAAHNVLEATYWDFGSSALRRARNPLTTAALASHYSTPVGADAT